MALKKLEKGNIKKMGTHPLQTQHYITAVTRLTQNLPFLQLINGVAY